MSDEQYETIITTLQRKKNIILEGVPGVGKTYCAKKIMYALMNEEDDSRIETVQFHPSYSYEDFIQGYRPNDEGNFELKDGKFYELVQKACKELERAQKANEEPKKFCIIIDEINRGNLSKIFGELIMLIENNKREEKYSIKLTYSDEPFYIPENLYIIGTMNTADRSLAMMDYALKRRFGFIKLEPIYEDAKFEEYLIKTQKLNKNIAHKISIKYTELNKYMESNLGEEFKIGHSYFMEEKFEPETFEETYKSIVNCEIKPIIDEYFYGDKEKIKEAISKIELDGDIHE